MRKLDSYTTTRLQQILRLYSDAGLFDYDALLSLRRAMHGGVVPLCAGDTRSMLRKADSCHNGAITMGKLEPLLTKELISLKTQSKIDKVLSRAEDRAPYAGKWLKPGPELIELLHERAEELGDQGDTEGAMGMYSRARELWSRVPPFRRRLRHKFNAEHLATLQDIDPASLPSVTLPEEEEAAEWKLPRGWQEHHLPMSLKQRRYYHGLLTGKSQWVRPMPDDWTEDALAPMKRACSPQHIEHACSEVAGRGCSPFVVDHASLYKQHMQERSNTPYTLDPTSTTEEVREVVRRAIMCGFMVVYLADQSDAAERIAAAQFNAVHEGLLEKLIGRQILKADEFASVLPDLVTSSNGDTNTKQQTLYQVAGSSESFVFVWVQRSMALPSWATKDSVHVLEVGAMEPHQTAASLKDLKQRSTHLKIFTQERCKTNTLMESSAHAQLSPAACA